jgi:hypothetical protein
MFRLCTLAAVLALVTDVQGAVETCDPVEDATCVGREPAASLLQKAVNRHDEKAPLAQERKVTDISAVIRHQDERRRKQAQSPCTINEQGRCWYLSAMGESCGATCAAQGRGFDFVVADNDRPLMPKLVGHEPSAKQEPWAAFECYVPSEDRYHTSNANGARHMIEAHEDLNSWKHEACKLSCPCSTSAVIEKDPQPTQCSWRPVTECASQFLWKGQVYKGCASVDTEHERPWCQHGFEHVELKNVKDWSYCDYSCPAPAPAPPPPAAKKDCQWTPAYSCAKDFEYEGAQYSGCTTANHDIPWCSNTAKYEGSWNNCFKTCSDGTVEPVDPKNAEEELCSWQAKPECQPTFEYKGVDITGCTSQDYPTPWCSQDRIHDGIFSPCTRVCNSASGAQSPVPKAPSPPVPEERPEPAAEDPCTRHPEAENDIIGQAVTLDEAGYKVAAAADSPINMKRFVCRVVEQNNCKVLDLAALMAFVPYYSGAQSQQSYRKLEGEITTLCHAGGKWLAPKETSKWP